MAIIIQVPLSDTEQAAVMELASRVAPGLSGQQLIDWVATSMKRGFRGDFIELWLKAEADRENQTRQARQATLATDFPEVP